MFNERGKPENCADIHLAASKQAPATVDLERPSMLAAYDALLWMRGEVALQASASGRETLLVVTLVVSLPREEIVKRFGGSAEEERRTGESTLDLYDKFARDAKWPLPFYEEEIKAGVIKRLASCKSIQEAELGSCIVRASNESVTFSSIWHHYGLAKTSDTMRRACLEAGGEWRALVQNDLKAIR